MRARRRNERGQVAVYAVVLFPLLVLVLSLVYIVGNVEDLRSRIQADLDMAALTATQALDPTALATGAPPRLLPDEAAQLARQYLAQNLAGLGSVLAESPSDAAAAADVAVARAGASTLAELLAFGLPAILMPYPFHRDQHQMHQAKVVETLGAAAVVTDLPEYPDETWRALAHIVEGMARSADQLAQMAAKARAAGRPQAAETIAREVLALADAVTERRHAAIESGAVRQA